MGDATPWVITALVAMAVPICGVMGVIYQSRKSLVTVQTTVKAEAEAAKSQLEADAVKTRLQLDADVQKTAREVSIEITEALLNRLNTANIELTARVEKYETKVNEQTMEMSRLNQRIGGLEADNSRLSIENESLRKEIDRLVNEIQRERAEKYTLSNENAETTKRLNESIRERGVLAKRVDDLEKEVARLRTCIGADRRAEERTP